MCDSVTRKRSLDSLKKEAKRWLDALHRDVPDARTRFERVLPKAPAKPTLRDVQHDVNEIVDQKSSYQDHPDQGQQCCVFESHARSMNGFSVFRKRSKKVQKRS